MEREDNLDFGNWTPWMAEEEEPQLFQPPDLNAFNWSSLLQQTSGAVEDTIPLLSNMENDSILQTFVDLNNNSYTDYENMASGLSTPELAYNEYASNLPKWEPISGVQSSPSVDLEKHSIPTIVNPVFASSARVGGFLQTPADSSRKRPRCSSTSDIPDKTTQKKPRKRLTSEVERKEKRKESNRKAAGKYRHKQREAEKYRQENHDRLMEEITKLRERNEFLERKLEFCTCHSRVCPSTEPL